MHPMMEIRFRQTLYGDPDEEVEVTVNWYHVPSVGDEISLFDTDIHGPVQGRVQVMEWAETYVIAHLRGRNRD